MLTWLWEINTEVKYLVPCRVHPSPTYTKLPSYSATACSELKVLTHMGYSLAATQHSSRGLELKRLHFSLVKW